MVREADGKCGKDGMIRNYPFKLESSHNGLRAPEFMAVEIEFLTMIGWLSQAKGYKEFLEIGRYKGHTTWYLNHLAREAGGSVQTVDVVPLSEGMPYSHEKFTQERSQKFLRDTEDTYDFILIDGGHTTSECIEDFTGSMLHLNQGGTIAIHDIVYMEDVNRAVESLKDTFVGEWMDLRIGKGMTFFQKGLT